MTAVNPSDFEALRGEATRLRRLLGLRSALHQEFLELSTDYPALLQRVALRLTEALCDGCHVRLLSDDGCWLECVASFDRDPELDALVREVTAKTPLRVDAQALTRPVLEGNTPRLLPDFDMATLRAEVAPAYWPLLERTGVRSVVIAPLRARGRCIGLLYLARRAPGRFDEADLTLAQDLADLAALVIENARLLDTSRAQVERLRRADAALRESQALLERSQRAARIGSWRWHPNAARYTWSAEAFRVFGVDPAGFDGGLAQAHARVHPEDRAALEAALAEAPARGTLRAEFRVVLESGELRHVGCVGEAQREGDGEETVVLGVVQDVTEPRALQQQLLRAQKLEAVGRLAAGVAHDFNNLLTVIASCAETLRAALPPGGDERRDAEHVAQAADRAIGLSGQLLALSRAQAPRFERVDLNRVAREMEGLLRRVFGKDVALSLDLASDTPMVWAPAGQIAQVVMNLAINARDAIGGCGHVWLSTRRCAGDPSCACGQGCAMEAPGEGPFAALSVRDDGAGMDDVTRRRIFDPFFTTKPEGRGTGLGLSTARAVVEQCGGVIAVESAPGAGSTFTVMLPAIRGDQPLL